MSELILFWHRRDLRLDDNMGLYSARLKSPKIVGCFCFDPESFNPDHISPAKVTYLIESLKALQAQYRQVNSDLYFLQGQPEKLIPQFAQALDASAVYWNLDVEPERRKNDDKVKTALKEQSIEFKLYWDQLLHPPGEILTKGKTPYTVYTPFWKNWHQQPKPLPVGKIEDCTPLTTLEKDQATAETIPLPTAQDLGFVWNQPLFVQGGETVAQEQLEWFCDQAIADYQYQRNIPSLQGTSRLSTALNLGVISIRKIWQSTQDLLAYSRSDEYTQNIQTWQKELAWREFYQQALYFFPQLKDGAYRDKFKQFPWENKQEDFEAWCAGKTGYPIVDAAMRELKETGWMHNRCRMIVASFLTKDLMINWQWGEAYFMKTLIDGDLAANNGGWQWSASSGMDPKPLRIFNPASQAQKFDPEGEYIRQWLPEIASLDTGELVTGKIPELTCYSYGYPLPIVDHKVQQREFKQRYQLL